MGLNQGGEGNKENYQLDNSERVQHILDHGEELFHEDNPPARRHIQEPRGSAVTENAIHKILRGELDKAKVRYQFDNSKVFIPRSKFAEIMTPERVLEMLYHLRCFKNQSPTQNQTTAQDICFGSGGRRPALKVFVALIASKNKGAIDKHLQRGLNDGCLPLKVDHRDNKYHLQCRCSEQDHMSVMNSETYFSEEREGFARWIRYLTAPYIKCKPGLHSHYVLDTGNCIPINPTKQPTRIVASSSQKNSDARGTNSGNGSYGGFSEVYKVKLHDCHCQFPDSGLRNSKGFYAIKKLISHNRHNFEMELSSLLFSADRKGNKKHMIQVLATFEELNPLDQQSTFYLLFDCAEGDLEHFWKLNMSEVGKPSHCPWMSEQLLGLAQALEAIHNDRQNFPLPDDVFDPSNIYGRHGDIKPSNILCFHLSLGQRILALADFGLGRLHTKVSRSKQDPNSLERTATYRPPEFDLPEGLVGPTSDVWSLGCVFLEYITWFLLGPDSHDKFSDKRLMKDIHGFEADTFFILSGSNDKRAAAEIKPAVKEWIKMLKEQQACSWYLFQMLELIEDNMLAGEKDKRIRATPLVKKLQNLQKGCQDSETFYIKHWKDGDPSPEQTWRGWILTKADFTQYISALSLSALSTVSTFVMIGVRVWDRVAGHPGLAIIITGSIFLCAAFVLLYTQVS